MQKSGFMKRIERFAAEWNEWSWEEEGNLWTAVSVAVKQLEAGGSNMPYADRIRVISDLERNMPNVFKSIKQGQIDSIKKSQVTHPEEFTDMTHLISAIKSIAISHHM